jgi:hypothetical protein
VVGVGFLWPTDLVVALPLTPNSPIRHLPWVLNPDDLVPEGPSPNEAHISRIPYDIKIRVRVVSAVSAEQPAGKTRGPGGRELRGPLGRREWR